MSNELNNISQNSSEDREKLLQQLNEDLFAEDDALDQQFEEDASIGLQQINQDKIPAIVDKLNADLSRHLGKKKKRRGIFKDPSNINITIITILVLIIISYIIIKKVLG
jgi:hypothetical protein